MPFPIVFRLILSLGLLACASHHSPKPQVAVSPKKAEKRVWRPQKKSQTRKVSQGNAVWHLVSPEIIELFLIHEKGQSELIRIDTPLSDLTLAPGNWQVQGVVVDGVEFEALEQGAKFTFNVDRKRPSYVGSFVVECPRVSSSKIRPVKKMEFFNRFSFTSLQGTCEMLVGNDLKRVSRAWARLEKLPPSRLRLGF